METANIINIIVIMMMDEKEEEEEEEVSCLSVRYTFPIIPHEPNTTEERAEVRVYNRFLSAR